MITVSFGGGGGCTDSLAYAGGTNTQTVSTRVPARKGLNAHTGKPRAESQGHQAAPSWRWELGLLTLTTATSWAPCCPKAASQSHIRAVLGRECTSGRLHEFPTTGNHVDTEGEVFPHSTRFSILKNFRLSLPEKDVYRGIPLAEACWQSSECFYWVQTTFLGLPSWCPWEAGALHPFYR